jgi:hypothetical protein
MTFLRSFIAILLLVAITGCSSTGSRGIVQASKAGIPPGHIATLVVDSAQDPDSLMAADRLRALLMDTLVSEGGVDRIVSENQNSHYDLEVRLVQVRKVSDFSSFMLGVFAGSDEVHADISLFDRRADNVVSRFTANGKGAAHPFSPEKGMGAALAEIQQQVILGLC